MGYTDKELLNYLKDFVKENGRSPVRRDFIGNPEYPNYQIYRKRFESWTNALKLVELDVDTIVKNGIIKNNYQKGRFAEIIIRDHFKKNPIDLAGKNCNSPCDGICPNNKIYDVKSSSFREYGWQFGIDNEYKEEIEIFYLLGFNKDYSILEHVWRIPGEIIESSRFYVGMNYNSKFNIKNMNEYEITGNLKDIIKGLVN